MRIVRLSVFAAVLVIVFAGLAQADLIRVIGELRHAKWCEIVDPKGEVDANAAKRAGDSRGITIVLHPQGALPTFLGEQPRGWTPKEKQTP